MMLLLLQQVIRLLDEQLAWWICVAVPQATSLPYVGELDDSDEQQLSVTEHTF